MDLHPQHVEHIGYDTELNDVVPNYGRSGIDIELNYSMPILEIRDVETRAQIWDGETLLLMV